MKEILEMIGVRIEMEYPVKMERTEFTQEFLKEDDVRCMDGFYRFQMCDELPGIEANGVRVSNNFYTQTGSMRRKYVYAYGKEEPYACVEHNLMEPYLWNCYVLKDNVSCLSSASQIFNIMQLEELMLAFDAFILHSSFVRYQGDGILFSAPSGTGKSTQAELWRQYLDAVILNGDRTGIRNVDGKWKAYGLPIAGSSGVYRNECADLKMIVVLEQAKENRIKRLRPMDAFKKVYKETTVHYWDEAFVQKMMGLVDHVIQDVPVYLLQCKPDEEAVFLTLEALKQQ